MKQSLQLRLGQSLTMTPQLQQAIRLLQLSTLDLRAEVQELLETNPMLEASETDEPGVDDNDWSARNEPAAPPVVEGEPKSAADSALQNVEIPEDLPVDSSWDDVYDISSGGGAGSDGSSYESQSAGGGETLREHLVWQMQLSPFSDRDQLIAEAIIDSISDDGYLSVPLDTISEGLRDELPDLEADEVEVVLRRVQAFDPLGVGARDLRECLMLQLRPTLQNGACTELHQRALDLVEHHLAVLGARDYNQLVKVFGISKDELQEIIVFIQSLNPRPGSVINPAPSEYVVPDVIVRKEKAGWRVELNPDSLPRLRINSSYANLIRRADNSNDNTYLKNNLQEARWFIKSLQSRNETLLKVATCIVERQQAFLEHGEEAMKALVLHDVAETVSMHESTISRVTSQKYMHTPRGIFELKYFFSSHVSTADGGEASATAIRALIKKMVGQEQPDKPLSDSKIANILSDQGINVARRTVAKYRESMAIPPSNERKRLA